MDLSTLLKDKILLFDGATGTMLQQRGLTSYDCPELWNITHQDIIKEVHQCYKKAGSKVIETNTFGGNRVKLRKFHLEDRLEELNTAGVQIAREVMGSDGWVAASIGPSGDFLYPFGSLTFDEMYNIFKEQIIAVTKAGADLIAIETMSDLAEARIALLAAKENSSLPVLCSFTFESNGRTLMGSDPLTAVNMVQSMKAESIGVNCSGGPKELLPVLLDMKKHATIPIVVQPNAGIPKIENGKTVYPFSPEEMTAKMISIVQGGANGIGGCCGTNEEHIRQYHRLITDYPSIPPIILSEAMVSSKRTTVKLSEALENSFIIEVSNEMSLDQLTDKVFSMPANASSITLDVRENDRISIPLLLSEVQQLTPKVLLFKIKNSHQASLLLRYYHGITALLSPKEVPLEGIENLLHQYGGFSLKAE